MLLNRERDTDVFSLCLMFCSLLPEIIVINLDNVMAWPALIPRKLCTVNIFLLSLRTQALIVQRQVSFWIFLLNYYQFHSLITRVCTVTISWLMTIKGKVTAYSARQQQQASPCFNLFQPSSALLTLSTPPAPTPTLVTLCKLKSAELTVWTGTT